MTQIADRAPRTARGAARASAAIASSTLTVPGFQLVSDFARPDTKKRLSLGALLNLGSSYAIFQAANGEVLLKPVAVVPANEAWLHCNPTALASVQRGLQQSAAGQTRSLGSFAKYAKE